MNNLPTPNKPVVTLRKIPERKYAVIRFSGFTGEAKVTKKTTELMERLANKGINITVQPEIARYNPLWTLSFLHRNDDYSRYQLMAGSV